MTFPRPVRPVRPVLAAAAVAAALVLSGCGSQEWKPSDTATEAPAADTSAGPGKDVATEEPAATPTGSTSPSTGSECEAAVSTYVSLENGGKVRQLSDPPELECLATVASMTGETAQFIFTFSQGADGSFTKVSQDVYEPRSASTSPAVTPGSSPSATPVETKKAKPSKKAKSSKAPKPSSPTTTSTAPKPDKTRRTDKPKPAPTVTVTATPDEQPMRTAVTAVLTTAQLVEERWAAKGAYPTKVGKVAGVRAAVNGLDVTYVLTGPKKSPTGFDLCLADDDTGAWAMYRTNDGLVGFGLSDAKCGVNL